MLTQQQNTTLATHLTHKGNLKHSRYGWLRLTPAYSIHLVSQLLDALPKMEAVVLDPFCGTGTTALVCSERGIPANTVDINPFLIWLTTVKTRSYKPTELELFDRACKTICFAIGDDSDQSSWIPPLYKIEKWWDEKTLLAIGRMMFHIREMESSFPHPVIDLLKIAFCRVMIECANVSFAHQSMSFKKISGTKSLLDEQETIVSLWYRASMDIRNAASSMIATEPRALLCDARELTSTLPTEHYTCVITSPPYPNRMSYIRELRPYMYWLEYLQDGRQAGELDWQAIGGTWGCATSNVGKWLPQTVRSIPYDGFETILTRIAEHSSLLSRYVHKYFYDMVEHINDLFRIMKSGGIAHYIVGNSKFYDVLLPVEQIFSALFNAAGFENVSIDTLRKRTSKKELYEYIVTATKP